MSATLSVQIGESSKAGIKPANEDACGVHIPEEPLLTSKGIVTLVADGVSRSEGGREASEACARGFLSDYFSTPESWTVKTSGQRVLGALNSWLYSQGHKSYTSDYAMVTTLSAIVIKSSTAHLFHVGDSRIYRMTDGDLERLTQDHHMCGEGGKSYLARAMGAELHVDIDYRSLPIEVSDIFLLTTDGVHEYVSFTELKKILNEHTASPEQAARTIVTRALENGSDDNVTCQVLRIDHLPQMDQDDFYSHLTELPFPPPLEPGMTLDGYRITRELHASKRTQIYAAQDTESGERVILKTPSVNYEDDPAYIDQFLHEEWIGRRINNSHVLKVIEPRGRRRFLYYVTEYVEGKTLREWMNDNPKPRHEEVRNIIEQIATGLRAFHRLEMVHRDLKPENIMVDTNGKIILIDFGSTKIPGIEEIQTPYERNNMLGTLGYAAPEYFEDSQGTNQSDIYALGTITYEMFTGKLPYKKPLTKNSMKRVNYISVKHYYPEIPAWIDSALQKAVHLDPLKRYNELSELIHDLSFPNKAFINREFQPLIKRSPVAFWRALSIALLVLNLYLLYKLNS